MKAPAQHSLLFINRYRGDRPPQASDFWPIPPLGFCGLVAYREHCGMQLPRPINRDQRNVAGPGQTLVKRFTMTLQPCSKSRSQVNTSPCSWGPTPNRFAAIAINSSLASDLRSSYRRKLREFFSEFLYLLFLSLHFLVQSSYGQLGFLILEYLRSIHRFPNCFLNQLIDRDASDLSGPSHKFELFRINRKPVNMRSLDVRRLCPRFLWALAECKPPCVDPKSPRESPQCSAMGDSPPFLIATDLSRCHRRISPEICLCQTAIQTHRG